MIRRLEDWPTRLERYVLAQQKAKFRYGQLDCCLFVAGAIEAMTGVDIAPFREYHSRRTASQLAVTYCGRKSVRAIVEKAFEEAGMPKIPPAFACRGDAVLIKRPSDSSLGIVDLNGRDILLLAREGFARQPISLAVQAWRV